MADWDRNRTGWVKFFLLLARLTGVLPDPSLCGSTGRPYLNKDGLHLNWEPQEERFLCESTMLSQGLSLHTGL